MKKKKKRTFHPLRFLLLLFIVFCSAFLLAGGTKAFQPKTWQNLGDLLPRAEQKVPSNMEKDEVSTSSGDRISRIFFLKRAVDSHHRPDHYIPIEDIPLPLQQAVIAVEDTRFYSHPGFDVEGILRASLVNLQSGEISEGASTITQQLVKNLFLSQERTFGRKAEELILSLDMEANYSKEEILELYLNTIYFGSGNYGILDAAHDYFGKKPEQLNLAEASMLAGLPNAPSLYSPYVDFLQAKRRQFIVLDAMVRSGFVTKQQAEDAKIQPLYLAHE